MRKAFTLSLLGFILFTRIVSAQFQYVSPFPGSRNIPIEHNLIIRPGEMLDASSVKSSLFTIHGSKSGNHYFKLVLCKDGKTINLNPVVRFYLGETVSVSVSTGLKTIDGDVIDGYSFSFHTPSDEDNAGRIKYNDSVLFANASGHYEGNDESDTRKLDGMFTITTNGNPSPGDIFFDCRPAVWGISAYNSISVITNNGDSVFHRTFSPVPYDFQLGRNGYFDTYQGNIDKFLVLDSNFAAIDTYAAANGYTGDPHELTMLENGYAFLIANDQEVVEVQENDSEFVQKNVLGTVIQEFDPDHNVIFEWRSFDHVGVEEAEHVNFNVNVVDYIHTNSIEVDTDGNIIVSHRNLDQITKIDVNTGDFIWRLGGLYNQFTFTNDSDRFSYQHDCRLLSNGNITLYDDGNYHVQPKSYAKEYQLDLVNMTATLAWSYSHPDVNGHVAYYLAMGSVQRLPNGNTLIGWGDRFYTSLPSMTEVDSAGNIVWELKMSSTQNLINYRTHKYEWNPCARPTFRLLHTDDITDHSAKLSWAAVANPSQQYEVQYKKHVDSVWLDVKAGASQLSLDIDSLVANTEYDWRLQSWCDTVSGIASHFTAIVNFTTSLATGIHQAIAKNDIEIYPNPAYDILEIKSTFKISKIRIFNLLGQEVESYLFNEETADQLIELPVSNLVAGNYFVEVTSDKTMEVRKLVVEN